MKCLANTENYEFCFKNCDTCMVEAICKNCATHCHQGHNLQEYTDTRGYGGYTGRCNCNHEPKLGFL